MKKMINVIVALLALILSVTLAPVVKAQGSSTNDLPQQNALGPVFVWLLNQTAFNLEELIDNPHSQDEYPSFWCLPIMEATSYNMWYEMANGLLSIDRTDNNGFGGAVDFDIATRPVDSKVYSLIITIKGGSSGSSSLLDFIVNGSGIAISLMADPDHPQVSYQYDSPVPITSIKHKVIMTGDINFQNDTSFTIQALPKPVPEPTTITLIGLTTISVILFRNHRKRV